MISFTIFVTISLIVLSSVLSLEIQGCLCESSEDNNQPIDYSECYLANSTEPCSGRGHCCCGICDCFARENPTEKISGRYCECDTLTCARADGEICGGKERGRCECGYCNCLPGWTGEACDCEESNTACYASNGKLCSGHGVCECGRCKCLDSQEGRYSGLYCEYCPVEP